jgi:hypothetical protein
MYMKMKCNWYSLRFGPYFCQPVIAGLDDDDKPFICTMDFIGAKYVILLSYFLSFQALEALVWSVSNWKLLWPIVKVADLLSFYLWIGKTWRALFNFSLISPVYFEWYRVITSWHIGNSISWHVGNSISRSKK